jgi:pimeloyl-ACP methyl ester carboxylesterase
MTRRPRRGALAVLAAAVLALTCLPVPAAVSPALADVAPACSRSLNGSTLPAAMQSASSRPVVLVHGWTGKPMTDTAALLKKALGDKISTFMFDYSKWAANWPTNATIAPCLATYIHQVSAAYHKVGGDGGVILVAHSMGGLAIRYASDAAFVTEPITAANAPLVITMDTPHLGSAWGGSFLAEAKQIGDGLFGRSVPNPFGTDGAHCLQPHDNGKALPAQCGGLPPWLAGGTTLDEIAGGITIRRTVLGVHLYDIPTGSDGIVEVASSSGYRTSGPGGAAPAVSSATIGTTLHTQVVDCSVTTGQIQSVLSAPSGVFSSAVEVVGVGALSDYAVLQELQNGITSPAVLLYSAAALPTAGCSHIKITNDKASVNKVVDDIKGFLADHPAHSPIGPFPTTVASAKPGTVCGTVHNSIVNDLVKVTVAAGAVPCALALDIVDTYYNHTPGVPQGSGAFLEFDGWDCSSTSGAVSEQTGHYGTCEVTSQGVAAGRAAGGTKISLDRP